MPMPPPLVTAALVCAAAATLFLFVQLWRKRPVRAVAPLPPPPVGATSDTLVEAEAAVESVPEFPPANLMQQKSVQDPNEVRPVVAQLQGMHRGPRHTRNGDRIAITPAGDDFVIIVDHRSGPPEVWRYVCRTGAVPVLWGAKLPRVQCGTADNTTAGLDVLSTGQIRQLQRTLTESYIA